MRFLQTGRSEGLVLAVTAVSFAALVGAGLSSFGDPDAMGQATLARLAGDVAGGVVAEWDRMRRDPSSLDGELLTFAAEPARPEREAALFISGDRNMVASALLLESRRLDLEVGDPGAALNLVLEVLKKDLTRERRALIRLRAIQLAVRADRREVAAVQWQQTRTELKGTEASEGTSLLLLCGLAAGPALTLADRAILRDELVGLWIAGALALPEAEFEGSLLREAYGDRLQELLPEAPRDLRLDRYARGARTRALLEEIGEALPLAARGVLAVQPFDEGKFAGQELLYRRRDEQILEGRLYPVGTVAAQLSAAVAAAGLLPEGFSLDFKGDIPQVGVVVREQTLPGFARNKFVVRHRDPGAIISRVSERQALMRGAFFILALGVAGAGFSMFRAQRRERHLARVKSTFVANVSHELRTPIASILLMAENLEDGRVTDDDSRGRYHHLIRREAERLRRLVDDVLDFSRIERGKGVQLCLAEVDLGEFARALETEARARVTDAGGELRLSKAQLPAKLQLDADALRRAILNLVDNALRHSGVTDVELELRGTASSLEILVSDRGRGIPEEQWEALFLPFERLKDSMHTSTGTAGTGLGLAIVREIAEAHGGSVGASQPEESGVQFTLRLPLAPPKETL